MSPLKSSCPFCRANLPHERHVTWSEARELGIEIAEVEPDPRRHISTGCRGYNGWKSSQSDPGAPLEPVVESITAVDSACVPGGLDDPLIQAFIRTGKVEMA